ncbi:glycosyltransferase family 4 protein [Microbacterium hydrocarbonoxydans]|uniref:glycosyltransferase family 4 protein n=1 Tax=Microbacterium hydrocarbonoxydans TaxID=273678 RepID=UPI00203CDF94|nr:glycosyltransferase family 4 protein [Microbacterium hydrocarbonoxydans]MCM3778116.1 glycosyltransferase family 4 protein [Microbacterium hydrocarbonoxydans]
MRRVRHVQLYDVARTAHFERIVRSGESTIILYSQHRYDFDAALASEVGARKVGTVGAFWYALTHDIDVLEIAEPLLVRAAPRSFAAIVGARIRARFRRTKTAVVSYAIENKDPREGLLRLPLRAQLKLSAQRLFIRGVWTRLDRVAFGTSQAQALYRRLLGETRAVQRLIPALPVAENTAFGSMPRNPVLTFLGEFSERKGFPLVVEAWPVVARAVPEARLVLIGKGEGAEVARALGASDCRVRVEIDPPRSTIFETLRESKVVTLPSRPRPRWREQVGLPIVEALGNGCLIVTSDETGLAEWLGEHGHHVVPASADVNDLAAAMVRALHSDRSPSQVLADLPKDDGRAEAERWIVRPGTPA